MLRENPHVYHTKRYKYQQPNLKLTRRSGGEGGGIRWKRGREGERERVLVKAMRCKKKRSLWVAVKYNCPGSTRVDIRLLCSRTDLTYILLMYSDARKITGEMLLSSSSTLILHM